MSCKTGPDHIRSLQDGRSVFIDGAAVDDVTTHPAFRNSVASVGALYDFQSSPENLETMTFDIGGGRRVGRAWQMPRSYEEMRLRRTALSKLSELNFGFMGRSPDHVASALLGQRIGLEVFERGGSARAKAFADYFDHISRNDLFLTYVIINPQVDRSRDWGDQVEGVVARIVDEDSEGITLRGAKMLGTSTIMANEVFVANLQPLKPGEEDLAFSCALPLNAKGLRILSRKSYERDAASVFDNPISSRYDENDAVVYFDDVKVPWERVFVHRDVGLCNAQFHETPGHVYQNYQSQIRLVTKLRFLVGMAHRLCETIGTLSMPPVREQLGRLAAQVGGVEAMLDGMEIAGEMRGGYWVPNRHYLYAAQVTTQELYPAIVAKIRELAGGSIIMLPSSERDFNNELVESVILKTQRSPAFEPIEKVKFLKAVWDAVGSEFASRHVQYEMFYAGAQFVTAGHSFRTFGWNGPLAMVDELLGGYGLSRDKPGA